MFGTGPVLSAKDLIDIIDGLRANDLLTYSHLLIGRHNYSHCYMMSSTRFCDSYRVLALAFAIHRVYGRQVVSGASTFVGFRAEGEKQRLQICV